MLSSSLGYVLNATYIFSTSWIVSVNLMDTIVSEGDIERSVCLVCVILHIVDLWQNSETHGHFQTWHEPLSVLLYL